MKIRITIILLLLFTISGGATVAFAQTSNPPASIHIAWIDSVDFPQVNLLVSAWGADGLPLTGLQAKDFSLQEDGGAAFHPDSIETTTDSALWVTLVLDTSGSMDGTPLLDARAAATRFIDQLDPTDQVSLITFSDSVETLAFTADKIPVYDRIDSLQAVGATHLYEACAAAAGQFAGLPDGHRAVLLLSDGRNDPAGAGDPEEAIRLAQDANIPFFVIGLGEGIDADYLGRLASETGGMFRQAPGSADLARLFADMASLLKTQYKLSYLSTLPADGQSHRLSVILNTSLGSSSSHEIAFGPLPLIEPSPTVTVTDTQIPSPTPTVQDTPTLTYTPLPSQTPSPTPVPEPVNDTTPIMTIVGIVIGIIFLLSVIILMIVLRRKKLQAAQVACPTCGYRYDAGKTACPQCGETRRLPGK